MVIALASYIVMNQSDESSQANKVVETSQEAMVAESNMKNLSTLKAGDFTTYLKENCDSSDEVLLEGFPFMLSDELNKNITLIIKLRVILATLTQKKEPLDLLN